MKALNLGLRFLLELVLLASMGYGASQLGTGAGRWLLAVGAALLVAIVWGVWIAPHARSRLPDPWRFGLEVILFAGAVMILLMNGHAVAAIGLGVVVAINLAMMLIWHQR